MKPADALSRGRDTPELSNSFKIDMSSLSSLDALMELCNPTIVQSLQDYHAAFVRIHDLLSRFD